MLGTQKNICWDCAFHILSRGSQGSCGVEVDPKYSSGMSEKEVGWESKSDHSGQLALVLQLGWKDEHQKGSGWTVPARIMWDMIVISVDPQYQRI